MIDQEFYDALTELQNSIEDAEFKNFIEELKGYVKKEDIHIYGHLVNRNFIVIDLSNRHIGPEHSIHEKMAKVHEICRKRLS